MKTILPLVAGVVAIAAAVLLSFPPLRAQQPVAPAAGAPPVGLRCEVTLDPRAYGDAKLGIEAMKKTGLTPEGTVEGVLVSMDDQWLILKDGTYENWIHRDKVLFIRVSR
jgi:hypothetical protein